MSAEEQRERRSDKQETAIAVLSTKIDGLTSTIESLKSQLISTTSTFVSKTEFELRIEAISDRREADSKRIQKLERWFYAFVTFTLVSAIGLITRNFRI